MFRGLEGLGFRGRLPGIQVSQKLYIGFGLRTCCLSLLVGDARPAVELLAKTPLAVAVSLTMTLP